MLWHGVHLNSCELVFGCCLCFHCRTLSVDGCTKTPQAVSFFLFFQYVYFVSSLFIAHRNQLPGITIKVNCEYILLTKLAIQCQSLCVHNTSVVHKLAYLQMTNLKSVHVVDIDPLKALGIIPLHINNDRLNYKIFTSQCVND